jgi:hypothetical protein
VVDPCEHGNEPSVSVKSEVHLDTPELQLVSQEGLCSIDFISICTSH